MYLVLHSEIRFEAAAGKLKMVGAHEVTVNESIHEITNTCNIKLPASTYLKRTDDKQLPSVQKPKKIGEAKPFKRGDKVFVNLGYDKALKEEFRGFVTRVTYSSPVEIECEGYSWLLRNKKNITKSWKNTDLLTVLKFITQGLDDIKLHDKIPAIPLKNLSINNATAFQVIEYIKSDLLKDTITAFFQDNVLYVGLTYVDFTGQTVKYVQGKNVIEDNLKLHEADDVDVKIEFKHKAADGTEDKKGNAKTEKLEGKIVRKETVSAVDDVKWLGEMAKAKLLQETYNGYEGSITTFLTPYCRTGYRADYKSEKYPEKNGIYFVSGQQITFGQGGGRRELELDLKLS